MMFCMSIRADILLYVMPQKPKYELDEIEGLTGSIGRNIARIRKANGMTQSQLGEAIGISQRLVSHYEQERLQVNSEMLTRFALALGVTSDEILGLTQSTRTDTQQDLKLTKRIRAIEKLPMGQKRALMSTIDAYLKAHQSQ